MQSILVVKLVMELFERLENEGIVMQQNPMPVKTKKIAKYLIIAPA
jgi:hypothetical protein